MNSWASLGKCSLILMPGTLVAISLIVRNLPATTGGTRGATKHPASNAVVLAATLVAAITFAVMIGSFYLAEQYLQRAAGYSPRFPDCDCQRAQSFDPDAPPYASWALALSTKPAQPV